jgi:hypothetical protein
VESEESSENTMDVAVDLNGIEEEGKNRLSARDVCRSRRRVRTYEWGLNVIGN